MRNILSIIVVSVSFIISITSCKKTLDEINPSGLTPESVYSTPQGFETLVNAAYSYQRFWYGKEEGYSVSEMGTDIWASGSGDVFPDLTTYKNLGSNNGALTMQWQQLYAAINVCNAGISRIEKAGLTPAARAQREAELRFLRAFYYWHIVETWGGVHFTTQETVGINTTANKTPVDTFYAQIFRDLQFAVNNLAPTTKDYGRVTKPAAMSFLARMYLTRGMNAEANAMARAVINGGFGFQLQPNYADLWSMTNLQNKEVVYAVNYSTVLSLNDASNALYPNGHPRGSNSGHLLFLMFYQDKPGMVRDIPNGRPFNRYMPTRALLDMFNEEVDARYDGSFQQVWYANNTSNRPAGMKIGDTAIYITKKSGLTSNKYVLLTRDSTYAADGKVRDAKYYISLSKFKDASRSSINEAQSARDVFVIRFAELYLIAAEAQFKLGRSDSAAYYLNIVRTRAAKPGKMAEMQVTPAQVTLDFILDERAREFAGEQIRWFDLKRTGKLIERIKALNPDAQPNIQPHHVNRPIPQSQLDAVTNRSEFSQNLGYQ